MNRLSFLRTLTDKQLTRLHMRVYHKMTGGMGYQPFGIDRRTMLMIHPDLVRVIDQIMFVQRER
jgi:hypothetical protein